MKKAYLIITVVLLAVFMAGCDNFVKPVDVDAEPVQYAADGTRLATLSMRASGLGRALTATMDQAGTTYCEASFEDTTTNKIVRTTWRWASTGKITIIPGEYNVILFVGRGSDKTLLGVGRVTNVAGTGGGGVVAGGITTIVAGTTGLTFTVNPLLTNIEDSATCTFDMGGTVLEALDEFGNTVPVFMIPKSSPGAVTTTATWTLKTGTLAASTLANYNSDMIIGATGGAIKTTGFSNEESLDVPQVVAVAYTGPTTTVAANGEFTFTITPGTEEDGGVLVALEIPVYAISSTDAKPVTWYIRGGLNNSLIDAGITPSTQKQGAIGGAVIVAFGNISAIPTIILTPTWLP